MKLVLPKDLLTLTLKKVKRRCMTLMVLNWEDGLLLLMRLNRGITVVVVVDSVVVEGAEDTVVAAVVVVLVVAEEEMVVAVVVLVVVVVVVEGAVAEEEETMVVAVDTANLVFQGNRRDIAERG